MTFFIKNAIHYCAICDISALTFEGAYAIINVGFCDFKEGAQMSKNTNDYSFDSNTAYEISSAIARKKENRKAANKKLKKKKQLAAALSVCAVVLVIGAVYLVGLAKNTGRFLDNTFINDVDVSGLNTAQAIAALRDTYSVPSLEIDLINGDTVHFDLSDFNYSSDISTPVKKAQNEQNHALWFTSLFKEQNITIEPKVEYDESKLERQLRRTVWGNEDTKDASIAYGENGYYIVPEVYGDTVNIEKLVPFVLDNVKNGVLTMSLTDSDCYSEPAVRTEDLSGKLDMIKEKYDFIITYDFDFAQEYLTGAQVYEWTDENGNIDRAKAESFVSGLADKYDTFMTTRTFKSTERGEMKLSQGRYSTGQYGWWIDQQKTVDRLLDHIEEGESMTIDPVYVKLDTGYTYEGFEADRSATDDIGKTYIEVDLTAQHLWYYEDGELKFETKNIVSGKATDASRKTPPGIYSVYTKSTNYTMIAPDNSYRAKCSYFMRLSFEGIGLHDLSRGSYGGNTYINNGSHGCINMMYSEVKQLYEMVERGTPCIMYY